MLSCQWKGSYGSQGNSDTVRQNLYKEIGWGVYMIDDACCHVSGRVAMVPWETVTQ